MPQRLFRDNARGRNFAPVNFSVQHLHDVKESGVRVNLADFYLPVRRPAPLGLLRDRLQIGNDVFDASRRARTVLLHVFGVLHA